MPSGYDPLTVKTTDQVLPSFPQAIAEAISRLQHERGAKDLAQYFDGREGRQVAVSTISRWISEPHRFPAVFLPVLVELDPELRAFVFQHLAGRMVVSPEIQSRLSPGVAAELAKVQHALFLEEIAPGRWRKR